MSSRLAGDVYLYRVTAVRLEAVCRGRVEKTEP